MVFLGAGSSTEYKNLRNEMLENGMNLAVRRHHVTLLQGTVLWTDALSQELKLMEAFYNHNGSEARLLSESVVVGRTTGIDADDSAEKPVEPVLDEGHTQDSRAQGNGPVDDKSPERQKETSETKSGETTTDDVPTDDATKELLVDKGAQPMIGTTIPSHRKRTKNDRKKVSKLSLKKKKPASTNADNSAELPLGLYIDGNKLLRKRLFPCPCCHEPADG
jgi:hypothetical protein